MVWGSKGFEIHRNENYNKILIITFLTENDDTISFENWSILCAHMLNKDS